MDEAVGTFIAEAQELLSVLEAGLLQVGEQAASTEQLNEIFRCAHTIKGSAGLFGFEDIVRFTHDVENVLDRARDREIQIDHALLKILLRACDHIHALVSGIAELKEPSTALQDEGQEILVALQPWVTDASPPATDRLETPASGSVGLWHISLKMGVDALKNGMDPIAIIRYLKSLGEICYIELIDQDLSVEKFDAENLYLGFELGLNTSHAKAEIEEAFVFVRDDANIKLIPPKSNVEQYLRLIRESTTGEEKLGEILVRSGAITQAELDRALDKQQRLSTAAGRPPIGEVLVSEKSASSEVVSAAIDSQVRRRPTKQKFIRVDAERLDI